VREHFSKEYALGIEREFLRTVYGRRTIRVGQCGREEQRFARALPDDPGRRR
jgi:hypothetical protein